MQLLFIFGRYKISKLNTQQRKIKGNRLCFAYKNIYMLLLPCTLKYRYLAKYNLYVYLDSKVVVSASIFQPHLSSSVVKSYSIEPSADSEST